MLRVMEKVRMREATTIAALLVAGMAWGLNGFANAAEPKLNFTLVAVDVAPPTGAVKHVLVLSGNGTFTTGSVTGGGVYQHLDFGTKTPKKILGSGTWKATKVLQWVPNQNGATYGKIVPGFVDLRVDLIPEQGPVIKGATLRINCNVPPAGIKNNDPDTGKPLAEGYWLTIPTTAFYGTTSAVGPFKPRDPTLGVTIIYQ